MLKCLNYVYFYFQHKLSRKMKFIISFLLIHNSIAKEGFR